MELDRPLDLLITIESIAFAARYLAASSLDAIVNATTASPEVIELSEYKDSEKVVILIADRLQQLVIRAQGREIQETVADEDVAILVLLHYLSRFVPRRADALIADIANERALDWARAYAAKHQQPVQSKSTSELLCNDVQFTPARLVTGHDIRIFTSSEVLVSYNASDGEGGVWPKRGAAAYYRLLKRGGFNQVSLYSGDCHWSLGKAS